MANWLCLLALLVAFCLLCPALTTGRTLHLLQEAIEVSYEPDPDAANSELLLQVETTYVETHNEESPFSSLVSENDEDYLALSLITSLQAEPSFPIVADNPHIGDSSITSLLSENGLPIGLLPSSVESYNISDDGQFSVSLSKPCYVDFDYEVYYAQTITGTLSYGAISDLSGIQAKKAFIWLAVTGIRADDSSSSYIYFDVGPFSKKLSISQFESVPVCKAKAMDLSALA